MSTHIADPRAFKRAAQAISKLPEAGSLASCQTALARATGHRDLHHAQALQADPRLSHTPIDAQDEITWSLHRNTGLNAGDLLDALIRARFFSANPELEEAFAVREKLFAREFPVTSRQSVGASGYLKASGHAKTRFLLLHRSDEKHGSATGLTDHKILRCISSEISLNRVNSFFIPLRFWAPYGYWTEQDGSKVIFSRDYCPLWRIEDGKAPVRDDPHRLVRFTSQKWFFSDYAFGQVTEKVAARSIDILKEHRIISLPTLVESLPKCLREGKSTADLKKWSFPFEVA